MLKRTFTAIIFMALLTVMTAAQTNVSNPSSPAQASSTAMQTVYLPSGTEIQVRVNESLSSERSQAGDTFTGSLINSIDDDRGYVIFERGTPVTGRVISAKPSGRLSDSGELVLTINSIRSETKVANLTVSEKEITGVNHSGSNTAKIGGGAVLGAIIGGIAGGGKGAAIGAGAGAAAGTGAAAATGKKEAKVDPESIVHFVTSTETAVVPVGSEAAREMERRQDVYSGAPGAGPRDSNAPVLRRRDGSTADGSASTSSDSRQNASVAQNMPNDGIPPAPRDSDVPVLRRRDNSSASAEPADSQPNSSVASDTSGNRPAGTATDANANAGPQWGFSARDRRVISNCLADNPSSVPAKTPSAIAYRKGDTLPYGAQRQLRSLPLACERQLMAAGNDQERVIYNQQVLLINSNSLVLDAFDVNPQQP